MKSREASFSITFRHWLKANPQYSCAYEMKQCTGPSFAFNLLEDHQATYLQATKSDKGTLIRVQGTVGEPDYVYLRNAPAYVVLFFKQNNEFHLIDVDTFLMEKGRSLRKSLTNARAREISTISVKC